MSDMTLTIQEEDYLVQDLGFTRDAASEQPSGSNDTTSLDSLSSSEHESDASSERKAGVRDTVFGGHERRISTSSSIY
jgi:CCR4-NOT transcriptional regulation complex NOT5 subunit